MFRAEQSGERDVPGAVNLSLSNGSRRDRAATSLVANSFASAAPTVDAREMQIRTATGGDLEGILALYRELQPTDPILDTEESATHFREILDRPGMGVLVSFDD